MKSIDVCSKLGLLHQTLSADKAKVAFLIGAGCSTSIKVDSEPLIPNIAGVTKYVDNLMDKSTEFSAHYATIKSRLGDKGHANPNIEMILTHIRLLQEVVSKSGIDSLTEEILQKLEREVCDKISSVVNKSLPQDLAPHHKLARWIQGIHRAYPVEIFTPNYDLLIEQALEETEVPYFDGFSGSKNAFFDLTSMESDDLPARWTRLWKLHGSINWWKTKAGAVRSTVDARPVPNSPQMIFPSHLKYDQSRKLPYLAMMDRLTAFLSRGNGSSIIVLSGYSCADDHINHAIIQGLTGNIRSSCFCFIYGKLSDTPKAIEFGMSRSNIIVLAEDKGIVNCEEVEWSYESVQSPFFKTCICDSDPKVPGNKKLILGDFVNLGTFLTDLFAITATPATST